MPAGADPAFSEGEVVKIMELNKFAVANINGRISRKHQEDKMLQPARMRCLKAQVGLLQTAHYWANTRVLLVVPMRRGLALGTINLSG